MMISPQHIYEELKGKPDEEVLLAIRKFRREISKLKKGLESSIMEEIAIHPFPDVQIRCIREYIDEAKRILTERGVEYKPVQAERKALDFNTRLSELTQIQVVFSGFSSMRKCYIITFGGSSLMLSCCLGIGSSEVQCGEIEMSRAALLSELEKLYIGEWKSCYPSSVLDGIQWEVRFTYADRTCRKYAGSNAYPYNFYELMELLTINEEMN